jgi:hypothetical protein
MRTIFLSTTFIAGGVVSYKYYTRLRPISENEIIWSWLRDEMYATHQFTDCYNQAVQKLGPPNLLVPDFNDAEENVRRRAIFWECRGRFALWDPIYKSTTWYKKRMLILPKVIYPYYIHGPFKPTHNKNIKGTLNGIILWGHDQSGPFIVLEGNHRWYDLNKGYLPFIADVYVGLSPKAYPLHSTSGCDKC